MQSITINLAFAAATLVWLLILWFLVRGGMQFAVRANRRESAMSDDEARDIRLARRLRNPELLMAYCFWKAVRYGDKPPRLADFQWAGRFDGPNTFTATVDTDGTIPAFRYLRVGAALEARLGCRPPRPQTSGSHFDLDDTWLGSLEGAYRQCVRTRGASYEYANYDFGDASPVTFERLILPFEDRNGSIKHLVGVVLFEENEN